MYRDMCIYIYICIHLLVYAYVIYTKAKLFPYTHMHGFPSVQRRLQDLRVVAPLGAAADLLPDVTMREAGRAGASAPGSF